MKKEIQEKCLSFFQERKKEMKVYSVEAFYRVTDIQEILKDKVDQTSLDKFLSENTRVYADIDDSKEKGKIHFEIEGIEPSLDWDSFSEEHAQENLSNILSIYDLQNDNFKNYGITKITEEIASAFEWDEKNQKDLYAILKGEIDFTFESFTESFAKEVMSISWMGGRFLQVSENMNGCLQDEPEDLLSYLIENVLSEED